MEGMKSHSEAMRSPIGRTFIPPPPVPSPPYGVQGLDPSGPLFPEERIHGGDFPAAPAPVYVDGDRVPDTFAMEAEVQGYDLSDFLTLAARNNPTIRQARLQISAQTAKALQAGLYPNPTINYIGEQIGVDVEGDKDSPGEFQGMTVRQRFVTAGKLKLSREKYMRRAHVSEHLAMAQQFRVCNDVRIHFFRALAAREKVQLRKELLKAAEDGAVTARELYNLGQATRPAVRKSSIALQRARLDVLTAENHYRESFRRLVAIVGVDLTDGLVSGDLMPEGEPISYREAVSLVLSESPELAAARAKLAADRVTVRREQVEWIPDIVAEGGAGYNFEAKETTAAAGVSIELPIFDRNQGTIRQAQLDLRRQQEEIRRTELMLQQEMANIYQQYLTALQIASEYDRVIIPEAKLAYQELLQSYKANRVDWPTVLDAQVEYFDSRLTRVQYLEQVRTNEVLIRGYLLHGGLMAAPGPTPPGHIDAVAKPR
ncbi:Cobalt-zinc-cadmium resistance protein CzcC precursor [Roseimaritima ulvae]|uniref:Cobalt-zinc-cadmium resistance protein CzcC n=2 Tax=Roseimaritima ulvae TaxID=980254 RepID=A0A5B9QXK4_9BACT|nr:Cobalt-zinc-cadmium resistance protein CzcC precursor [Roseimaritima ulvae]